jgi:hypothetical protein
MTMTEQCLAQACRREPRWETRNNRMLAILRRFAWSRRKSRDFVDLRELPPYLQRDLGLRDGRPVCD